MHVRRQNHHHRHHGLRRGVQHQAIKHPGVRNWWQQPRTNFACTRHRRHCHSHICTRCGLNRIRLSQHLVHCQFRYHQTKRMCLVLGAYRVLVLTRTPYEMEGTNCAEIARELWRRKDKRERNEDAWAQRKILLLHFACAVRGNDCCVFGCCCFCWCCRSINTTHVSFTLYYNIYGILVYCI